MISRFIFLREFARLGGLDKIFRGVGKELEPTHQISFPCDPEPALGEAEGMPSAVKALDLLTKHRQQGLPVAWPGPGHRYRG